MKQHFKMPSLKDLTALFGLALIVIKTFSALFDLVGKVFNYARSLRELRLLVHQR
jgi:hypothetical protein